MTGLSILVVDDEPLARGRMLRQLKPIGWIGQVHEAANLREALAMVQKAQPDIVLLDIEMPDGSGFDLLSQIEGPLPAVVFVTAFDDRALKAFDANAVDYVTKPLDPGRLRIALERARQSASLKNSMERITELEEVVTALRQRGGSREDRASGLWVKARGEFIRIDPAAISHIRAERDYVRIHAQGREYLHHENLAAMQRLLPAQEFLRIHRSTLVRIDAVERIRSGSFSSLVAVLKDGTELRVGRTYTAGIRDSLAGRGTQLS